MRDHPSCSEKWLFEVFQIHRNDRIVQEFGVSSLYRFPELRNGLSGHVKITYLLQRDESIGLDRDLLVQFGAQLKGELEHISRTQFVSGVAFGELRRDRACVLRARL